MEERDQSSVQRLSWTDLYQKYFENKMILTYNIHALSTDNEHDKNLNKNSIETDAVFIHG